jgi:hypothetical protein
LENGHSPNKESRMPLILGRKERKEYLQALITFAREGGGPDIDFDAILRPTSTTENSAAAKSCVNMA